MNNDNLFLTECGDMVDLNEQKLGTTLKNALADIFTPASYAGAILKMAFMGDVSGMEKLEMKKVGELKTAEARDKFVEKMDGEIADLSKQIADGKTTSKDKKTIGNLKTSMVNVRAKAAALKFDEKKK